MSETLRTGLELNINEKQLLELLFAHGMIWMASPAIYDGIRDRRTWEDGNPISNPHNSLHSLALETLNKSGVVIDVPTHNNANDLMRSYNVLSGAVGRGLIRRFKAPCGREEFTTTEWGRKCLQYSSGLFHYWPEEHEVLKGLATEGFAYVEQYPVLGQEATTVYRLRDTGRVVSSSILNLLEVKGVVYFRHGVYFKPDDWANEMMQKALGRAASSQNSEVGLQDRFGASKRYNHLTDFMIRRALRIIISSGRVWRGEGYVDGVQAWERSIHDNGPSVCLSSSDATTLEIPRMLEWLKLRNYVVEDGSGKFSVTRSGLEKLNRLEAQAQAEDEAGMEISTPEGELSNEQVAELVEARDELKEHDICRTIELFIKAGGILGRKGGSWHIADAKGRLYEPVYPEFSKWLADSTIKYLRAKGLLLELANATDVWGVTGLGTSYLSEHEPKNPILPLPSTPPPIQARKPGDELLGGDFTDGAVTDALSMFLEYDGKLYREPGGERWREGAKESGGNFLSQDYAKRLNVPGLIGALVTSGLLRHVFKRELKAGVPAGVFELTQAGRDWFSLEAQVKTNGGLLERAECALRVFDAVPDNEVVYPVNGSTDGVPNWMQGPRGGKGTLIPAECAKCLDNNTGIITNLKNAGLINRYSAKYEADIYGISVEGRAWLQDRKTKRTMEEALLLLSLDFYLVKYTDEESFADWWGHLGRLTSSQRDWVESQHQNLIEAGWAWGAYEPGKAHKYRLMITEHGLKRANDVREERGLNKLEDGDPFTEPDAEPVTVAEGDAARLFELIKKKGPIRRLDDGGSSTRWMDANSEYLLPKDARLFDNAVAFAFLMFGNHIKAKPQHEPQGYTYEVSDSGLLWWNKVRENGGGY